MRLETDRLVAMVQRRWLSLEGLDEPSVVTPRERTLLNRRVDRLRAMGDSFAPVRLSGYVAGGAATGRFGRVRDGCVVRDA